MLLAVDVGNTNVVFALCEGADIRYRWRIATDARRTADQYLVWLHQLMEIEDIDRSAIADVMVACVVPQTLYNLRELAQRITGREPLVAGSIGVDYGIDINLPDPSEAGADRIVNAVAAHQQWPGNLIIVDFGTATTFDVLSAGGGYEGGVIAPGINLSIDALFQATAQLPRVAVEPPAEGLGIIGKGTVHAMQSGIFWGYMSLIEGLIGRMQKEIPGGAKVVATGGLAPLFQKHSALIQDVDPDLTIKGLIHIHALNYKG